MISIFLAGVILVAVILRLIYKFNWDKGIYADVRFKQEHSYAGGKAVIVEKIENRKKMPVPVMEVGFDLDRSLIFSDMENTKVTDMTYRRDIFALLGNQRITRHINIDCSKRGYYSIKEISYKSFSMFYKSTYIRKKSVSAQLYVYPQRVDVSDILMVSSKVMGARQCAKQIYEDPFAFSSIREYTITDPMKTINWKASAKTGELMVNTFESTDTESVMIYLDVQDRGMYKYENLVEDSISVAATLIQKLINRGIETGISVNHKEFVRMEPCKGAFNITKAEKMLACLDSGDNAFELDDILESHPKDAVAVVISKNADRKQHMIEEFAKKCDCIWVLPYQDEEGCSVKADKGVHLIKRSCRK